MDFRSLEAFVAVAEEESFSLAAKRLGLSQPTMTSRIQHLEETLGFSLFHRSTRSLELTALGRSFLTDARLLLEERRRIMDRYEGARHRLFIGVSSLCARVLLPRLLGTLAKEVGDLPMSILRGNSGEVLEDLRRGRIDLALVGMEVEDTAFETIALYEDAFVAIFPKDGKATRLLLREEGSGTRNHLMAHLERLYPTAPTSVVGDTDLLISLVAEGTGFSVVSRAALAHHVEREKVRTEEVDIPPRSLYLVTRKQRPAHESLDVFLRLCRQEKDLP